MKCLLVVVAGSLLLGGTGRGAMAGTYTTDFSLTENPISQGGNWINGGTVGLDWSDVAVTNGLAHGTQFGTNYNIYNDSTALLTGSWGSNQAVSATVFTTNQTADVFEEVELRLRSTITEYSCTGYEVLFGANAGGYAEIVRWNGALGDFTYINQTPNGNYNGISNGDVVSASITNDLIIGYVNGVEVIRGTDSTWTSGNPGMGFYLLGSPSALGLDFGFTSFAATDDIKSQVTLVPAFTNGQFSFSFPTVTGQSYFILQFTNLAAADRGTYTMISGTGAPYQFNWPVTNSQRASFFRVLIP